MIQKIAKIESTMLGYEDHGILTAYLHVKYGGATSQGIGGYALDEFYRSEDGEFEGRFGTAYGMEFVCQLMRACGVSSWEKLPGRTIFVLVEDDTWGAKVLGIENLPTEPGQRFIFADVAEWAGIGAAA